MPTRPKKSSSREQGADRTATALPARARNQLRKYDLNIEQLIPTEPRSMSRPTSGSTSVSPG